MARRARSLEEIAEYRTVAQAQLRRDLLAGRDTHAVRQALADLDQEETEICEAREEAERDGAADHAQQARELAEEVRSRIGAVLAALEPPVLTV